MSVAKRKKASVSLAEAPQNQTHCNFKRSSMIHSTVAMPAQMVMLYLHIATMDHKQRNILFYAFQLKYKFVRGAL